MTKAELIEQLALHNDIEGGTKAAAGRVLEFIIDTIATELANGNDVDLSGFGSFKTSTQAARTGKAMGVEYSTPAKRVAKFRPSAPLKRLIAGE